MLTTYHWVIKYLIISLLQWLLILTTVEGKEYLIEAPDQTTRDEWQLAIEDIIRKLDPSKVNNYQVYECYNSVWNGIP